MSSCLGAPFVSLLAHSLHPLGCHLARYGVRARGRNGRHWKRQSQTGPLFQRRAGFPGGQTNGRTSQVVSEKFHGKKVNVGPSVPPSLPIRSFATTALLSFAGFGLRREARAPCMIGVACSPLARARCCSGPREHTCMISRSETQEGKEMRFSRMAPGTPSLSL